MSGLLRRFRRGKPKAEDEPEPSDEPGEVRGSDTDIYPHRGPETSDDSPEERAPEGPIAPDQVGGEPVSPPAEVPDEIGPPPESGPELPESRTPGPEVVMTELPPSTPPRLPEAADGAGRTAHRPLNAPGHCFLCGSELTGSYCPTCRMTWNE
jgi:hypothetical protein